MATLGTLTTYLDTNNTQLDSGLKQGRESMGRFVRQTNQGFGSMTASLGGFRNALIALGATTGALMLFKDMTETGSEFGYTMATVGGVMRATATEMENLTASARRMGETTEFTASQAGQALRFLGMAGFQAADAISALPGVLNLATAGSLDLGRSADIASNALTAMTLPVEQLGRVNDVFIGTITRSNVNMEQMAEAFKYGAPVANAFGYSIEELSAMIGTLGNAGIQGSMAGTQLAMAIQQANDVAIKFGYESSDLLDVLERMAAEGRTNADIMDLFGIRAGRAALILRDSIGPAKEFQQTLGGVGGEAEKLASKMRDTFSGTKKELTSVIESLKIDVFGVYEDSLRETMQETIAWLRNNRDEIIEWAERIVQAFKIVWNFAGEVLSVVGVLLTGIGEVFSYLGTQMEGSVAMMKKHGEEMRGAFVAPKFEPWEEFFLVATQLAGNVARIFMLVSKSISALINGVIKYLVEDVLGNVIDSIKHLAVGFERFIKLDFSGAWGNLKDAGSSIGKIWTDSAGTGLGIIDEWGIAWQEMIDDFDFRTTPELKIDKDFERTLAQAQEEANKAAESLAPGNIPEIHQPKDVTFTTTGEDSAQKTADKILDARVNLYRELLGAENKTKEELLQLWGGYETSRIEQIQREGEELVKLGLDMGLVSEVVATRMEELNEEQRTLFEEQGSWLNEWAEEIAHDMKDSMSDIFFDVLKGEFTSLTDYFNNVWNNMLRKIADSASNELFGLFENKGGGGFSFGNLFDKIGIPGFANGGIVSQPTLAMVGETGPEAIVPMNKMRDENFLNSLNAGGNSAPNVVMNIQTQDLSSFQKSHSQLMAQASVALRGAHRRST